MAGGKVEVAIPHARLATAARGRPVDSFDFLIIGIGNALLTDDGIGVHMARLLAMDCQRPADVGCVDGGTLGYLLAGQITDTSHLIVIDAAQLDSPPGTVKVFENDAMDRFLNGNPRRSVHEVGLADLMTMALLTNHLPPRRALIAVQPRETGWGTRLSAEVADSVPLVREKTWELVGSWRQ